jgi:hypothetical protein
MNKLESKIIEALKRSSPLKAREIAAILGARRKEVNRCLYSTLQHQVIRDDDFRWHLKEIIPPRTGKDPYEEIIEMLDQSHPSSEPSDPYENIFEMLD